MSYEPLVRDKDDVSHTNSSPLLDIRSNYVLRLHKASINEFELSPILQRGFRDNISRLTLEERAEVLRYLKFKTQNLAIAGNKIEERMYLDTIDYFIREFI